MKPLFEVEKLTVSYGEVAAVEEVSFSIAEGDAFAVVGESGCGKSTLLRALLRLVPARSGSVRYRPRGADGAVDLLALGEKELRRLRPEIGIVFQDPFGSLNPRMSVGEAVGEPLCVHAIVPNSAVAGEVAALLERVGLEPALAASHPHELSGGQRQRVAIARALATRPRVLLLDEPTSALDASVRAQLLNLLLELREGTGMATVLVAHDLAIVRHVAGRVAVMQAGRFVETGTREQVFSAPRHEHTRALLAAMPRL